MNIEFSPNEARVIGCLIEKEITTPDQYPLSLNALTNACNQKTNREPVLELSEAVVQQAVDSLMKKYMVSDKSAGLWRPRDQVPASVLQHRVRSAEVLDTGARHHLRAACCAVRKRRASCARAPIGCASSPMLMQVESTLKRSWSARTVLSSRGCRAPPGERESRYAHLFFGASNRLRNPRSRWKRPPKRPARAPSASPGASSNSRKPWPKYCAARSMRSKPRARLARTRLVRRAMRSASRCPRAPRATCRTRRCRRPHAAGVGLTVGEPLLHGGHQPRREVGRVIEQIHVRDL